MLQVVSTHEILRYFVILGFVKTIVQDFSTKIQKAKYIPK